MTRTGQLFRYQFAPAELVNSTPIWMFYSGLIEVLS